MEYIQITKQDYENVQRNYVHKQIFAQEKFDILKKSRIIEVALIINALILPIAPSYIKVVITIICTGLGLWYFYQDHNEIKRIQTIYSVK